MITEGELRHQKNVCVPGSIVSNILTKKQRDTDLHVSQCNGLERLHQNVKRTIRYHSSAARLKNGSTLSLRTMFTVGTSLGDAVDRNRLCNFTRRRRILLKTKTRTTYNQTLRVRIQDPTPPQRAPESMHDGNGTSNRGRADHSKSVC